MAQAHQFKITIFQRQPGLWRANIMPISSPASGRMGMATLGFVTDEDNRSEGDAIAAANRAIKKLAV